MTVHVFIHSIAKRAETISLLDSGATENFLNLEYAKWLCLPIKKMTQPRKLFNVDGTENKVGQLQYYTDLAIRTGSTTTNSLSSSKHLTQQKHVSYQDQSTNHDPSITNKSSYAERHL